MIFWENMSKIVVAVRKLNMATNDNTVTLIKCLGSDEAGDKIGCWFSPFENHEVSRFLQNCLRFHFSPGSLVEEIVFVELLLMTPPGHGVICGQGLGQNRSLLFVWYCTVCCKVEKKYCTFCCKVEKSIVQSAVKLTKSIVQFVVKTGVVCALIHDRKKFHGRGTLLLLVKNDAELLKMKTTCTSDK